MYIADMLSRTKEQTYEEISPYQIFQFQHEEVVSKDIEAVNFADHLRVSKATQQRIKNYTQSDETLQMLLATVASHNMSVLGLLR